MAPVPGVFPEPGSVFADRYDIVSLLAVGGFGQVYRARDAGLDRDVALKVMSPIRLARAGLNAAEKRFYREARLISQLVSPHTVRLFDYGRTNDGLLFLVFEYVHGRTLADVVEQDGPMPEARVRTVLVQLLESLREAHGLEILHRDIKPSNVMVYEHLGQRDRVKVIDFGVAKSVAADAVQESKLTVEGLILGTPRYMSPEQAMGATQLTPASDLFSVGLVAYEVLVGRSPYAGALEGVRDVARAEHVVPKLLGISEELRAFVNRLLRGDPAQRFQSAEDALRALGVRIDGTLRDDPPIRSATTVSFPILHTAFGPERAPTVATATPVTADPRVSSVLSAGATAAPPHLSKPPPLPHAETLVDTSVDISVTTSIAFEIGRVFQDRTNIALAVTTGTLTACVWFALYYLLVR